MKETYSGSRSHVITDWKQLLSDHLLIAESHTDIEDLIASTIINTIQSNQNINIITDDIKQSEGVDTTSWKD